MREPKYERLLFADFSAIICIKRAKYVTPILEAGDLHDRMVFGSDLPVPCLNFAIVLRQLQLYGYITGRQTGVLRKIYKCNPYLFDLTCKLMLTKNGKRLPFESFYEHNELRVIGWKCPKYHQDAGEE